MCCIFLLLLYQPAFNQQIYVILNESLKYRIQNISVYPAHHVCPDERDQKNQHKDIWHQNNGHNFLVYEEIPGFS